MPRETHAPRQASWLPEHYRILPEIIPFHVPGFIGQARPSDFVLAPNPIDCSAWFDAFGSTVLEAVGKRFLPVCRMSDGEFLLLFGPQLPSPRHPPAQRLRKFAGYLRSEYRLRRRGLQSFTARGVSSGNLTYADIRRLRPALAAGFADVARRGMLGLHLSYGNVPYTEHFFPAIGRWLDRQGVTLTPENYVPFYFVYGLLRGPLFPRLMHGRRVLVVHSATGEKRRAITAAILAAEARAVDWLTISPSRSFDERIDLSGLHDRPDLCLIGAGLGKGLLFPQLEPLGVPCIDAGFAFEVWANPDQQWDRPYMTPDTSLDISRIRFLSARDRETLAANWRSGGGKALEQR